VNYYNGDAAVFTDLTFLVTNGGAARLLNASAEQPSSCNAVLSLMLSIIAIIHSVFVVSRYRNHS